MLESGVLLSGRYRLDVRLATGGMGDVWRATDTLLNREVAAKVLLPRLLRDPDFVTRFRTEARTLAGLRHPGIVQVYDCGEHDLDGGLRTDYLVMEYVDGEPLSARINEVGRLSPAETMSIVAQVAQALHAAHSGGVIHRDVKPSNLLVQPDGTVVLVDFGVARSAAVTSITSADAVPGTALYMAPEQAAGRPVSPATDIYALGAVAYCCLTGTPPFTADSPLQVAVRHLDDEPPPLPDDVPASVRALVERALAKDPAHRQASAAALADEAVAAGGTAADATDGYPNGGYSTDADATAATRPVAPVTAPAFKIDPAEATQADGGVTTRRSARRRPAALLASAGVVLLAGIGLAATLAFTQSGDTPRTVPQPAPSVLPTEQVRTVPAGSSSGPAAPGPADRPPTATPPAAAVTPTPSAGPTGTPAPQPEPTTAPSAPQTQEPTEPTAEPSEPEPSQSETTPAPTQQASRPPDGEVTRERTA